MIVQTNLLDHPKFLAFEKGLADAGAVKYLLRLWAHCQELRKGQNWGKADCEYVESVCKWAGEPGKLFAALEKQYCGKPGWIHRNKKGELIITEWAGHNKFLVANWKNGDEGGRPKKDPKAPKEKKVLPLKGPLQLRAEKLMRRRPETPLADNEERAFRKNKAAIQATTEEDWVALEAFYAAPQQETFHRTDLATLLNNWNGEIDRAKAWQANPNARKQKVSLTEQLKALESIIAEHPCNPESRTHTGNETDVQRQDYRKMKASRDSVKQMIAAGGKNE